MSDLTVMDWFCGAGGSSQGIDVVPGVAVALAANHSPLAMATHETNFPHVEHKIGDIRDMDVDEFPDADLFWASPECTKWSRARGKKRTFHQSKQDGLWDDRTEEQRQLDADDERSRALMLEVPQYLQAVRDRGRKLILAGVVENVIDEREWDGWDDWINSIRRLGYKTRTIALNSMHAQGTVTPMAPQSRDRLYVAYWHESLGRDPDWDKWLRPTAWCEACDEQVAAVQVFKRPGQDMGRYRSSYVYRCPRISCRNSTVEPIVLPASEAIDWEIEAQRIGDRKKTAERPEGLAPATVARIRAGMAKFWEPLLVPAGGTWRTAAAPVSDPFAARTTRESDGLALPPLFVPVEGRDGKVASPGTVPLRAQTTRRETGIALPPFVIPMRGGGDAERAREIAAPLHTVSAGGNHHGLIEGIESLLVPYYGNGRSTPVSRPVGVIPTVDRYALASPAVDIADVRFRMLEPHEIARAMAFVEGYIVLGDKRAKVKQYGNAVTPPAAELIVSALVEAITGAEIERLVLAA